LLIKSRQLKLPAVEQVQRMIVRDFMNRFGEGL
jgi:hypothetical protein